MKVDEEFKFVIKVEINFVFDFKFFFVVGLVKVEFVFFK